MTNSKTKRVRERETEDFFPQNTHDTWFLFFSFFLSAVQTYSIFSWRNSHTRIHATHTSSNFLCI